MIEWYARLMQSALNDISLKLDKSNPLFVIYTDAAEAPDADSYKEASDNDVEPPKLVFGIFDAQPSRMAPIPGITVLSITGTLTVMPEAKRDRSTVVGPYDEQTLVEGILNTFTREENGKTHLYTDGLGNEFNVSVSFSPVVCGDWQVHSIEYGETVPLSLSVYLTAVQCGVSSNDVELFIDGYPIFYESLVPARQKTADQFTYKFEPVKSVAIQHAFSIDAILPLQRSRICDALLAELMDGSFTTPHMVTLKYPSIERNYLCLLGNSNAPAKPGLNVGLSLSFLEAKQDVAYAGVGTSLSGLGTQFAPTKAIEAQDVTIGVLKSAFVGEVTLVKGRRYAYALYSRLRKSSLFGMFEYQGVDGISLASDVFPSWLARITYGE